MIALILHAKSDFSTEAYDVQSVGIWRGVEVEKKYASLILIKNKT